MNPLQNETTYLLLGKQRLHSNVNEVLLLLLLFLIEITFIDRNFWNFLFTRQSLTLNDSRLVLLSTNRSIVMFMFSRCMTSSI